MGDQKISPLTSQAKKNFLRHLLNDIQALEHLIENGLIEKGQTRIGAEQEYCLVNKDLRPAMSGPEVLATMGDPHFTSELARWNLEINLDPQDAGPGCLNRMDQQLAQMLTLAQEKATAHDNLVVLTGILPTIRKSELDFEFMTPNPRYKVLGNILKEMRGEEFQLYIEGVDEVSLKHDSILFEACNTSFQVHLQVDPDEFADMYNWAQVISGPVLSCCVNSPILLGKELWSETRIALFRQSLDIRRAGHYVRDKQPRVAFGNDWLRHSAVEIFKNDVAKYKLLIAADIEEDSMEMVENGQVPHLRAMNLHNGTVYKWNRACYGVGNGVPHLRIENRYIPAGPTRHDEMANTTFWIGLMSAMPDKCRGNWEKHFYFQEVRSNFLKAARNGLSNEFVWFGQQKEACQLLLDDLLPMAADGLQRLGIPDDEFKPYLQIIEDRVTCKQTGSAWIINSLRRLRDKHTVDECLLIITRQMHEYCKNAVPGHLWELPDRSILKSIPNRYHRVDSIMITNVITVREDDILDFANRLMNWYDYHHLPVENSSGQITGIVTAVDVRNFKPSSDDPLVEDCMTKDILTTSPESPLEHAEQVMLDNQIGSLPVVSENRIVGIITASDIRRLRNKITNE